MYLRNEIGISLEGGIGSLRRVYTTEYIGPTAITRASVEIISAVHLAGELNVQFYPTEFRDSKVDPMVGFGANVLLAYRYR